MLRHPSLTYSWGTECSFTELIVTENPLHFFLHIYTFKQKYNSEKKGLFKSKFAFFKTIYSSREKHYFALLPLCTGENVSFFSDFLFAYWCAHIRPFYLQQDQNGHKMQDSCTTIIQIQDEKGQIWEGKGRKRVEKLCLFFSYSDHHLITILCSDFRRKLCLIFSPQTFWYWYFMIDDRIDRDTTASSSEWTRQLGVETLESAR